MRSVRYKLDGRRLEPIRRAARLQLAALSAGRHTPVVRVKPRRTSAQRVRLPLRVITG